MTPDAGYELAALQRRAYGPGEQAPLSAPELARLHELEERARAVTPAEPAPVQSATTEPPPHAAADAALVQPATADPGPEPAAEPTRDLPPPDAASQAASPPRPWWRSIRLWGAASAGLVVGVVAAVGFTALRHPPPDVVLHRAAEQDRAEFERHDAFGYLNLDPDSIVIFEPWQDAQVWTAKRGDGALCLIIGSSAGVGSGANDGYFDLNCALDGLDPQIDLPPFLTRFGAFGGDLPAGSTVRFVARGDTVDVWVREAGEYSDVFSGG